MSTTTFDELAPGERLRVWWSFMWRGFVIGVCSALGGAIAGFVIGLIIGLVGFDVQEPGVQLFGKFLGGLAGLAIGVALAWRYVRWLFRARLAGFRLLLAREPSSGAV